MTPEQFHAICAAEAWGPASDKSYPAGDKPPMHHHDFDATVLVTSGELHMVYPDSVDVLNVGDRCVVPAGTLHSEQPQGPGAEALIATRAARNVDMA